MATEGIGRNFKRYTPYTATGDGNTRIYAPPGTSFWAERAEDITVRVGTTTYTLREEGESATTTTYTVALAAAFATPTITFDTAPASGAAVNISLEAMQANMREDITTAAYSPVTATRLNLRAMLLIAVNAAHGGSGGGGTGGAPTDITDLQLSGADLRVTRRNAETYDLDLPAVVQNTNPYHYFEQHKDISINIPQGDQARIEATGDGYDIPFMAKTTHAQAVMAGRNFVTDPEGFINLHFSGTGVVRADISFKTTHHFSEVDSSVPDLTTSSRTEQQEVVLGEANSVNLRAHGSNVVVTPQSTGGSLAGRSVPISIVVNVKVFNNTGARVPGNVWGSGNKAGITFWQLADNSGAQGAQGQTGAAGAPGAPGQDGTDGTAATIRISQTLTGAAGSNATLVEADGSTANARNYILTVPRGADGSGGGTPAPNSIGVAQLDFASGTTEAVGRAITIGSGGELGTAVLPAANQLLPTTGSAGGRALVDVYSNGQITPTWRARIIGFAGGSGDNTAGFQAGDILRVPVGGGNPPNYYLVDSGRAPGESLAQMIAAEGVSLISPRDLNDQIGKNNLAFASGANEGAGRLVLLRADNTFDTVAQSDITGTTYTAGTGITIASNAISLSSATQLAIAANTQKRSYPSADQTKLAGIETGATADQSGVEIVARIEALTGNDRLNYNNLRNLPTNFLTGVASNATLTGDGTTGSPLAVATPASGDDLVGEPTISSGNLIFARRTGTAYSVPLPTGSAGTNVRRVLMATQQNITTGNAGAVNTFNAGQNISLDGNENFGEWDIIYFVCGYTETRATPDQDNDHVIAVDGTLFRASTAAARYVVTGSDTSTSGFTWGVYNNPNTGQTAANSNRVNIAARRSSASGGGGGDVYVKAIVGVQFRGMQGAQGVEGQAGQDGAAATIAIGTVTTGAAGSNAIVANSGTSGAAVFDFTIPRGATGAQGAAGTPGTDGQDGAAATITVGATTTGAAGTNATVVNAGSTSAADLRFTIPRGDTGAQGPQGARGTDGTNGQDGAAATIAIGTVTTIAAGGNADVRNSGSSSAAVFDFELPRGATGAAGAPGQGVPVGGTAGQVLAKIDGTDFNAHWIDAPSGGGSGMLFDLIAEDTSVQNSDIISLKSGKSWAAHDGFLIEFVVNVETFFSGGQETISVFVRGDEFRRGGNFNLANLAQSSSQNASNLNFFLAVVASSGTVTSVTARGNFDTSSGTEQIRIYAVNFGGGSGGSVSITAGAGIAVSGSTVSIADPTVWATNTQYPQNARVTHSGDLYEARTDITASESNTAPNIDTARWWRLTGGTSGGGTTYTAGTGINITGANAIEVAEATRNAIAVNSAKVGLYAIHGTAVGVWTGVSGDPDDSTVIAAGTTQFDSTDVYLSRTDATGKAVDMSMLPAVNGAINWGGFAGTVSAISENANRIKVTITYTGGAYPIANSGHKFSLFNSADPAVSQHGVYVDNTTLEGNGDPASHLRVKANGIGVAHLDFAAGAVETVGRFLTIGAGGKITTAVGGGGGTVNTDATITGDGSSGSPLAVAIPATNSDVTDVTEASGTVTVTKRDGTTSTFTAGGGTLPAWLQNAPAPPSS